MLNLKESIAMLEEQREEKARRIRHAHQDMIAAGPMDTREDWKMADQIDEIDEVSEQRWGELFEDSQDKLAKVGEEVLADRRRGEVAPLGVEDLIEAQAEWRNWRDPDEPDLITGALLHVKALRRLRVIDEEVAAQKADIDWRNPGDMLTPCATLAALAVESRTIDRMLEELNGGGIHAALRYLATTCHHNHNDHATTIAGYWILRILPKEMESKGQDR